MTFSKLEKTRNDSEGKSLIAGTSSDTSTAQAGLDNDNDNHNEERWHDDDSDDDDCSGEKRDTERIFRKLRLRPGYSHYPHLAEKCRPIVQLWHDTWSDSCPKFWKRMKRNLPKELNESFFILEEMIRFCGEYAGEEKVTIIDMCSGVGYLSMFLSHLLPSHKVSRIVPIDILFRCHLDTTSEEYDGQHLSTQHLNNPIHPIEIRPRRADIKSGRELRQIAHHCIANAPGPVIILGVHLCKSLSVHTVRLFNTTKALRLYLKPCCLPGRKELKSKSPPFWTFGSMEGGGFGLETLYCSKIENNHVEDDKQSSTEDFFNGKAEIQQLSTSCYDSDQTAGDVNNSLFTRWVNLLRDAANSIDGVEAKIYHSSVQKHHFQNQFIVATR